MHDPHVLAQVAHLLGSYCAFADHRDAQSLAELFTPQGRLEVNGHVWAGRDAIRAGLVERLSVERLTRHTWTSPLLAVAPGAALTCRSLQTTYELLPGEQRASVRVSDVTDVLHAAAPGAWLIESRCVVRVMTC